jgi:hypothetical protein
LEANVNQVRAKPGGTVHVVNQPANGGQNYYRVSAQ